MTKFLVEYHITGHLVVNADDPGQASNKVKDFIADRKSVTKASIEVFDLVELP